MTWEDSLVVAIIAVWFLVLSFVHADVRHRRRKQ